VTVAAASQNSDANAMPPSKPQSKAKRAAAQSGSAGENHSTAEKVVQDGPPNKEMDRPGSRELLRALKDARAWGTLVLDFAHATSVNQDEITFMVDEEFRDWDKALRRKTARAFWVFWSTANVKQQPNPEKCRIWLIDRYGHPLAWSQLRGGDIKLSDD
jgi:hypothetical protein